MKPEFRDKVKLKITKYGVDYTLEFFDNNIDVIKRAYQDNPLEFLDQFNDLIPVEQNNVIYYVDKDRLPLFYYFQDRKNGYVHINYDRIWLFFSIVIGMDYKEIRGIIKNWLDETYNLRGLTPGKGFRFGFPKLDETYNLRGLTPMLWPP